MMHADLTELCGYPSGLDLDIGLPMLFKCKFKCHVAKLNCNVKKTEQANEQMSGHPDTHCASTQPCLGLP